MADILSAGGMELIKYFCLIPFLCGFIIYILWVDKFLKKYVFWHRKREIKDFSEEEFDKPCGVLGALKESSVLYKRGVEYFKSLRLNKIYDWFSLGMLALFLWYLFYSIITLQHTDFDDSRFVALAGDILETGRLSLQFPAFGNKI